MYEVQGKEVKHMGQKETPRHKNGYCKIMNELIIKLEIPKTIADASCKSIGIETNHVLNRSSVDLNYEDDFLGIRIKANDLHALRAALNTYLRWIIMCYDLLTRDKNGTNS